MNALVEDYEGQDFYILGFPANNFFLQEPGATADEIFNGIKYVRPGGGFEPKFPLFKKIDVNGDNEAELYTYLKGACDYTITSYPDPSTLFYDPIRVGDIAWNFEKFLIGRDGKPYVRHHPSHVTANSLKPDIDFLLAQKV